MEHRDVGQNTMVAMITSKYYVPNVFTPNGDGENDYLEVFPKDLLSLY